MLAFVVFLLLFLPFGVAGTRANVSLPVLAAEDVPGVEEPPAPEELGEKMDEVTREKMKQGARNWQKTLESLSAHSPLGWLLFVLVTALGFALLGFGDRMLEKAFIPMVILVGIGAGSYLGLQLCILMEGFPSESSQTTAILAGAALGAILYALSSIKAPPVAWMLLVATPFFLLSAMLAKVNQVVAAVSAFGGIALAILACLRHHVLSTITTSMLGAFALTFSWGLLMHLMPDKRYRLFFDKAMKHPYLFALAIILIIGAGVDFQILFSNEKQ
jgi:hypothetical protein